MESDNEILKAVLEGRKDEYRKIIHRYQNQVSATIIGMIGKNQDCFDDIGQQVFLRFYKSLSRFRFDSSVGTYLTRIAINLSLNEIKRKKRFLDRFVVSDYRDEPAKEERGEEEITTMIQVLSPKERVPVLLRYLHGYSSEDSAQIMKISEGAFRTRLSRSLQKLRSYIEKENDNV